MQIDKRKHLHKKDFNLNKHASHFIVVGHQCGGRGVLWKDSIGTENDC